MKLHGWIPALVLVVGAALGAPADAASVYVRVGPPAPRVEVFPGQRHGYVWIEGHWQWVGGRYVWVRGHFVPERYGYVWIGPRWEPWNDRWQYIPGYWSDHRHEYRDRDHRRDHRDRRHPHR